MILKLEDNMTAAFLRTEQWLENLEVLAADRSTCNDLVSVQVEFCTDLNNLRDTQEINNNR